MNNHSLKPFDMKKMTLLMLACIFSFVSHSQVVTDYFNFDKLFKFVKDSSTVQKKQGGYTIYTLPHLGLAAFVSDDGKKKQVALGYKSGVHPKGNGYMFDPDGTVWAMSNGEPNKVTALDSEVYIHNWIMENVVYAANKK